MDEKKILRINELAKKARETGLDSAETKERDALRREYAEAFKRNLRRALDNTYLVDGDGNKRKLRKKEEME
jgi:uncharacterized protein YnzC (UPF0291/DUF896 family)